MESMELLQQQNNEISELCKVLSVLLNDASVCDTTVARELFERFRGLVSEHLSLEDNTLYSKLLVHEDSTIKQTALRFLNNSAELKKLFSSYEKGWCKKGVAVTGNDAFIKDTQHMFQLIMERIEHERDEFFPMVESVVAA